jgi:hypothetical protein
VGAGVGTAVVAANGEVLGATHTTWALAATAVGCAGDAPPPISPQQTTPIIAPELAAKPKCSP